MCTLEKRGKIYILTLTGNDDHRLSPSLLDSISAHLHHIRCEVTATPSASAALITTGEGKYFSNGGDMAWVQYNKDKLLILLSKIRSLFTDFMTLPVPTIAAVNGHASGTGCLLALSHDYVFMNKDRGFLYMNELELGVVLAGPFLMATLKAKISNPAGLRDIVLRAEKMTAQRAVEVGLIDVACDTVKETVAAAVELGEQLVKKNWDGQVYAENRKILYKDVLHDLAIADSDEIIKASRLLVKQVKSRI